MAMISRSQWRMAKKFGTRGDLLRSEFEMHWKRFWLCRVRRVHQEKFGSDGKCIRCGKRVR
jgi:hypothetical protein